MNHSVFRPANLAVRAVNRAIGEIRRGVAVCLLGGDGERLVLLPAETATQSTLMECLAAASAEPVLLLAGTRAAGIAVGADLAAQIVAFEVAASGLDVARLRALADPTMHQMGGRELRAGPSPYAAEMDRAALLLAKLARLLPAVLMAVAGPRTGAYLDVRAADVMAYPRVTAEGLVAAAEARVPLDEAEDVRIVAFRPPDGGIEHLAILVGHPERVETPLVRVHSECFTGDLLGSRRCDCGPQLHQALRRMAAEGAGIILYMAQEGRGIGLVNKLRAYNLQDGGLDTLDANHALGYGADERSFAAAATMLRHLGVARVRLLTNNPAKIAGLTAHGIEVTGRVVHAIAANGENDLYLKTKAQRFGHLIG